MRKEILLLCFFWQDVSMERSIEQLTRIRCKPHFGACRITYALNT
jgi:hypothetical protein